MDTPTQSKRLLSLDAFRGITIAAMILVNNPGSYAAVYRELQHTTWNGWTFTDCIFPFFLFIVGVSMTFSFAWRMDRGDSLAKIEEQVARRTIILFCLGLVLNAFPIFHLSTLRIPGVLQRISLCYFFTSLIVLKSSVKAQGLWLTGFLFLYWLAMEYIPVPELGAGVYEPGKNLAAHVDSLFLDGHMWSEYGTWDPEGLLSTIPAISTTLFGVMTSHWLRSGYSGEKKTASMLAAGLFLLLLGKVLDIWVPINKNIWTSSFSIFMGGMATIFLAVFYWLIDVKNWKRWAHPFMMFGTNSIAIYFLSEILDTIWRFIWVTQRNGGKMNLRDYIYHSCFAPLASTINASLLFAVTYLLLMFAVAWIMWKKRWLVKI